MSPLPSSLPSLPPSCFAGNLERVTAKREKAESALSETSTKLEEAQEELSRLSSLQKELDTVKADIVEAESEKSKYKNQLKDTEATVEALTKQTTELNSKLAASGEEVAYHWLLFLTNASLMSEL